MRAALALSVSVSVSALSSCIGLFIQQIKTILRSGEVRMEATREISTRNFINK
jgi:hypothetical protein